MRNVLFLLGLEDNNKARVRSVGANSSLEYILNGSIDLFQDISDPRLKHSVAMLGGTRPAALQVRPPHIIFNCVTDADANRRTLALAASAARDLGVPIINDPEKVLLTRRDEVATTLQGIPGLQVPTTIRFPAESHKQILDLLDSGPVHYPALLRRAGTHGGISMLLLTSRDDAHLLDQIACDGTEHYLTSFVDFRSADGFYRKIRILMVDGVAYARHRLVGDNWNMHANARARVMIKHPQLLTEEENFLDNFAAGVPPRWQKTLTEMHKRLGLDYFAIDCAETATGDLLLFEANASGNVLRQAGIDKVPYLRRHIAAMKTAVVDMLLRPR